jgi:DNA repair photolyase
VLEAAARAGARSASYVMLRLPREVRALFTEWLDMHEPLKAKHVMSRIRELRGGRDNDPRFGSRLKGQGVFAEVFAQRFELARRRYGLEPREDFELDTSRFVPPRPSGAQFELFPEPPS